MTTDEAKRHGLYDVLTATIGAEETDTLMAYVPTQLNEVLATKGDLSAMADAFDSRFKAVETRLDRVETGVDTLRTDLGDRIDSVNRRLDRLFLTLAAGLLAVVGTLIVQALL